MKTGFFSHVFPDLKNDLLQLIDATLDKIKIERVILFGLSSKFYQWLPGLILAEKLHDRFPGVKTLIGGFGNKDEAVEVLKIGKHYDLAIWGEGEYPLLALSNILAEGGDRFDSVPQLIFRHEDGLKTTNRRGNYLDFQGCIYPDFDDFFKLVEQKKIDIDIIELPIESERGCHWNRCKFCSGNIGYKYRTRTPEDIARQIDTLYQKYGITRFRFLGNDTVGIDLNRFEKLLDKIIDLSNKHLVTFDLFAEIVHQGLNSQIIRKMSVAGLTEIQIGYEAVTDELLQKIDKKTDFSDHLLLLKFAAQNGIKICGANIIRGIVGETDIDVLESINNLVFLRFFPDKNKSKFFHNFSHLRIREGTRFFEAITDNERKKWNFNFLAYLLPESFLSGSRRFSLFDFSSQLENQTEWEWFAHMNKFYEETEYTYNIIEVDDIYYYYEYMNGDQTEHIAFNEPEYWDVLRAANDEVVSFEKILTQVVGKHPDINRDKLMEIIGNLKSSYLLYANKDLTRIVSIIDTNLGIY
jgi:radical SAM superfamily enzyme YgiQ (UPF0313 family)